MPYPSIVPILRMITCKRCSAAMAAARRAECASAEPLTELRALIPMLEVEMAASLVTYQTIGLHAPSGFQLVGQRLL